MTTARSRSRVGAAEAQRCVSLRICMGEQSREGAGGRPDAGSTQYDGYLEVTNETMVERIRHIRRNWFSRSGGTRSSLIESGQQSSKAGQSGLRPSRLRNTYPPATRFTTIPAQASSP